MYLDSPFTLTEGRLLFEIARHDTVEVSDLRRALDINAGYLSRVLSRFEAESLITRHRSAADARRQEIRVADAGRAAAADLDRRSAEQIAGLLRGTDCDRLLNAMQVITAELGTGDGDATGTRGRAAGGDAAPAGARRPGLGAAPARDRVRGRVRLGRHLRGALRPHHRRVHDPARRPPGPHRRLDRRGGRRAGGLGLLRPRQRDHRPASPAAGRAVGPRPRPRRRLVGQCLQFARDTGYADITLWTYDRLAAARKVYQAAGFTLASEYPDDAFGHPMMSQTWSRPLGAIAVTYRQEYRCNVP